MKNRTRSILSVSLLLGLTAGAFGQKQLVFQAMLDEMARTMTALQIDTIKPPYYLAYTVTDAESYYVRATLGSLISSGENPHSRDINVQLRVGSQAFDNSNFVSLGSMASRSRMAYVGEEGSMLTSFEDDVDALRRDLWLATDIVYKRALDDLSKKRATLQNKVRTDSTADFSSAKPYSTTELPMTEKFDRQQWEQTVRKLSAVLKKFTGIQTSDVSAGYAANYAYFANNEGSQHNRRSGRAYVEVKASTQASDGMPLIDYVGFYGNSLRDLPGEKEMTQAIETMATELSARRDAVLLDSYSGPVLFEKQAAAELVAQALAPLLCNVREPIADNPQIEQMMKTQFGDINFQSKIGVRVMPDFLSVADDPTRSSYNGGPLIAGFLVDAEGVPSREVKLIEKGILKTLLTSRTPHKRIAESNGHARGFAPQPFFSNLFVTAANPLKDSDLKKKLLALCKERELEFGIIVRKMSNPYFKRQTRTESDMFSIFGPGGTKPLVTEPLTVYKVFADGREERVRGMEISGLTPQSFKEIIAASQSIYVYNHITGQRKGTYSSLFSPSDVRVSVVTPSLLFDSIDLKKASGRHQTPPVAPSPVLGQ